MELKTDCTASLSAFFLPKILSRHTDSACAVPAVRWVLCSSTDELGVLLSLMSTKRHSLNSSLKAENHVCPWFHASSQTLLLEFRHTKHCYGSFCEQFLGLQRKHSRWRIGFTDAFGVTDWGSNTCLALYQFSLLEEVVLVSWHFLPHWLTWN